MKKCSRCKVMKVPGDFHKNASTKDGLQDRCRECHLEVNREWAARNPEVRRAAKQRQEARHPGRDRNVLPLQRAAHYEVDKAIRQQVLVRPASCSCCGANDSPIQAHHDDYGKPLDVQWLCARCHGFLHAHGFLPSKERLSA